jgi:aryl-alcohol dehydrogenase-like predicted oxidoreductase
MNFTERVPLGRTGLRVSRMGLASGYGAPAAAIESAYHDYGINYLYVSPLLHLGSMTEAVRSLAPAHRDDLMIVLARPYFGGLGGWRLESFVERWLARLGLEWIDLILQDVRKPYSPRLRDLLDQLRQSGKVRHVGLSSHDRLLIGRLIRRETQIPADWCHIRYNAVHTGAEKDIFCHLSSGDRPGMVVFTATCWRKLLKPKLMPPGEEPLTAADCYRFVLSHPDVDVCLTAPATMRQMEDNFTALEKGPLDEGEMERVRRIGRHIYGKG